MTVYVDWPMGCGRTPFWRWDTVTYLVADSAGELHAFAARLGLKRPWFQAGVRHVLPHYDLTENKYTQALALGAVQLTRKTLREVFRKIRESYQARTWGGAGG